MTLHPEPLSLWAQSSTSRLDLLVTELCLAQYLSIKTENLRCVHTSLFLSVSNFQGLHVMTLCMSTHPACRVNCACHLILHVISFCMVVCIHIQVLRCQPENGAVPPDQPPAALMPPRPMGSPSPLDPSALSQHLATQELQAPKVSSAG